MMRESTMLSSMLNMLRSLAASRTGISVSSWWKPRRYRTDVLQRMIVLHAKRKTKGGRRVDSRRCAMYAGRCVRRCERGRLEAVIVEVEVSLVAGWRNIKNDNAREFVEVDRAEFASDRCVEQWVQEVGKLHTDGREREGKGGIGEENTHKQQ